MNKGTKFVRQTGSRRLFCTWK